MRTIISYPVTTPYIGMHLAKIVKSEISDHKESGATNFKFIKLKICCPMYSQVRRSYGMVYHGSNTLMIHY